MDVRSRLNTGSASKRRKHQRFQKKSNYNNRSANLKSFHYGRHYRRSHYSGLKSKTMNSFDGKGIPFWFWSNYYKTREWSNRHQIAKWKSFAKSLQQENKYLLNMLRIVEPNKVFDAPATCTNFRKVDKYPEFSKEIVPEPNMHEFDGQNEAEDDEIAYEMSDEMIKFLEQSYRHKLDMKKSKELEAKNLKSEVKELQEMHIQRDREMKILYGDGSSMIVGMETAVQLAFDKYCDVKSPSYWPTIPLNL